MSRPTLVSLAEELGVSRQTVSNVINQPHLVRESTRLRVQAAIDESGYRPSAAAQALRKQRSNTVALRLYPTSDGINGAVMDRFLHCVVEQAETLGHRVVLFTATDDAAEVDVIVDLVERNSIDACLLTGTTPEDARVTALTDAGVSFGAFGRPWGHEDTATHLWADVDGRAGVRMATEHLLSRGFERIGFIGWPEGSGTGDDRFRGFVDALAAARGVDADDDEFTATVHECAVRLTDGIPEGVAAAAELTERGVDAVVCVSDSFAVGALEVLRDGRENRFVPVIGFDDTPVARAMGLSSVAQPVESAATLLVHRLIGPTASAPDAVAPPLPPGPQIGPQGHLLTPTLELRRLEAVDLQEVTTG